MAYIGRGTDKISNIEVLDAITFTDSAGPYNITQSATAFTPISPSALVISIDGVVQSPASFTLSGSTITFDSVMAATSTMNFIYQIGVGLITTTGDNTVTTAKIVDDAVTYAKMQDIATGNRVLGRATAGEISEVQVSNDMLAGSIANSKLVYDSVTFNSQTVALGGSGTITVTDTHPTITSFTPTVIDATAGGTVTVTGTNFVSIPKVEMQNSSGALITAPTVSFTSATSIQFTTGTTGLANGSNVYLHITNPDGNGVRSGTELTMSAGPTWTTTSLANTESAAVISYNLDTDADSASTINPTPVSGALPSGTSIGGTTNPGGSTYRAVLSGTMPTVSVETAYSFTLRVTDDEAQTADQAFTLTSTVGITGGGGFC
jgi:hypothetical protein